MGVELFTEDGEEEKEEVPGDCVLVLDAEDPGVPKGLESSTDVDKTNVIAHHLFLVVLANVFPPAVPAVNTTIPISHDSRLTKSKSERTLPFPPF